ncbi:hypothetical protein [Niallia circulans]|uniref:hypothetical protein n=1 Tax=Niallia circulans TaxID=1397 RepID=UPI00201E22CC|nr:hypothetical protein [Niallia circulans]
MVVTMDLPVILAGPLVRRVEETSAYLWIALSGKYQLNANLYAIHFNQTTKEFEYQPFDIQSDIQVCRLGKNLYIYLIKLQPISQNFPTQTLLGYNLVFKKGETSYDLSDFGLLAADSPVSICYGNLQYPTFFIPATAEKNILYGSCRKLHGIGKDALSLGDAKLQEEYFQLEKRPSALFLIGDQIYADDVPAPAAPILFALGKLLMGKEEPIKELCETEDDKNTAFDITISQINGRREIIKEYCQFTSRKADNHLLSMGEYAAMYILSWNTEIWDMATGAGYLKDFDDYLEDNQIHIQIGADQAKEYERKVSSLKRAYNQQQKDITSFQQSLPKVRRLLANIPTYMIFDDHDVTDDWNITKEWQEKVACSPLGNHVIANALTAYWAFQGWGNNPAAFPASFFRKISKYTKRLTVNTQTYTEWQHMMLTFRAWSFVAPTNPRSLVLDTRTKRAYPQERTYVVGSMLKQRTNGPNLIRKKEWDYLSELLLSSGWQQQTPLVIISATPLYGVHLIESFLKNVIMPLTAVLPSLQKSLDLEWWKFNGRGFSFFHQQIAEWNPSECLILSGDAHMASAIKVEVYFQQEQKRILHQFTSSPIKNQSFEGLSGFTLKRILEFRQSRTKEKKISRYCGHDYLIQEKEADVPFLWKEIIAHQVLANGSLIDTKNNLGWLAFDKNGFNHRFLRK